MYAFRSAISHVLRTSSNALEVTLHSEPLRDNAFIAEAWSDEGKLLATAKCVYLGECYTVSMAPTGTKDSSAWAILQVSDTIMDGITLGQLWRKVVSVGQALAATDRLIDAVDAAAV